MRGQELPDSLCFGLQALKARLRPRFVLRRFLSLVPGPVGAEHRRHCLLHALCLVGEFSVGAAVALSALLGSFTPSMANICRPISPCRSQISSTCVKIAETSSTSSRTNFAIVVNCGELSPEIAMNSTFSRHSRSIDG